MKSIRIPGLGRFVYFPGESGGQALHGEGIFHTQLYATHYDKFGRRKDERDLGSGVVTNVGVAVGAALMSATMTSLAGGLAAFNYHYSGTGATAPAVTDTTLQTGAGPSPVTGTQTNVSVAGTAMYQSVATLNYTSTLAITEWGLFDSATLSTTTGTPFTTDSASSFTCTGTPWSANAYQGWICIAGSSLGIIASNTTSVATLTPQGWLTASADGSAGSTPSATSAFTLYPVMFDHRTFGAFNVVNLESIQFTYQLTWTAGG